MEKVLLEIHDSLGISQQHITANRLSLHPQPHLEKLQVVDIDFEGKPFILISPAAQAWLKMKEAALSERILLMPFSGFRSYLHQKNLIERHLKNGRKIDEILTHIAIPGFSEHHSGRAIDIHASGRAVLEEEFEATQAFAWLTKNAGLFDFHLSYPKANSLGIIYEPWHWFYTGS
jgi:zinc D-Ala-D-Ala carboxypeptidase